MIVWSANGKPDLRRGIRLAWAAYESRTKHEPSAITALITALHFETVNGKNVIVTKFTAEQIAEATGR
jgi:hypothetical protein